MPLSNLGKRLLFVLWAAPLGWWVVNSNFLLLPPSVAIIYPGHIAIIFLITMASFEYNRMLSIVFHRNGFWLSYLALFSQFTLFLLRDSFPLNLSLYILLVVVAFEAFIWGRKSVQRRWMRASLFFSGMAFLYIAGISMLNFYQQPFQSLFRKISDHTMLSQMGIVIVLTSIFLCDSGAYIVGSIWGKTHFSSISPKKTIEGSIGGLCSAAITFSIGWYFLGARTLPFWIGPVLGLLIGIFAQLGDLLVSLMKRYFRVKDASDIIPGHGGILDRFDSVFFTAPVISLSSWIIHRIFG
ncbi:MAG: phosphatidate cytidylyltransferase [Fibrobacter sp.]|jgi:phosphatidate cytidylyltransferase|nr:phosphatidate cytidylyltransferase [Fibrobacter sp.]